MTTPGPGGSTAPSPPAAPAAPAAPSPPAAGPPGGRAGAGKTLRPNYALSFRFAVTVGDDELGRWTSCNGLKVDFNPEVIKSGGVYTKATGYLPGAVTFPKITLRRAVYEEGSRKVQAWLAKAAYGWIGGTPDETGETARIKLLDAAHRTVMEWILEGVRPSAWHGPDLDASGNKVAVETLELVHTGFTVTVGKGAAPKAHDAQTVKLTLTGEGGEIAFLANPTEMGISYTNRAGTAATHSEGDVGGMALTNEVAGITSYTLSGLVLTGATVKAKVELLRTWATKLDTGQVKLTLKWGSDPKDVVIGSFSVTYTRFDPQGNPVRAKIGTLKLEEWVAAAAGPARKGGAAGKGSGNRNPSSGGIPGRAAHTVVLGQSLVSVAQDAYGSGASWRAIAEANGIDDPQRIAPGTVLYLPAPSELAAVSPADGAEEGENADG